MITQKVGNQQGRGCYFENGALERLEGAQKSWSTAGRRSSAEIDPVIPPNHPAALLGSIGVNTALVIPRGLESRVIRQTCHLATPSPSREE